MFQLNTGDNFLPFLELGTTSGVTVSYLQNVVNASSRAINIPGGFALGITNQNLVYVRTLLYTLINVYNM